MNDFDILDVLLVVSLIGVAACILILHWTIKGMDENDFDGDTK